jgi:hypothetical protein
MATHHRARFRITASTGGDTVVPPLVAVPRLWGIAFGSAVYDDDVLQQVVTARLLESGSEPLVEVNLDQVRALMESADTSTDTAGDLPDAEHLDPADPEVQEMLTRFGARLMLPPSDAAFVLLSDLPMKNPPDGADADGFATVVDFAQVDLMEVPDELWLRDFLDLAYTEATAKSVQQLMAFLAVYGPIEPPARLTRFTGALTRDRASDLPGGNVAAPLADLGLSSEQVRAHADAIDDLIDEWTQEWHHDSGPSLDLQVPWWMRPQGTGRQVSLSRTSVGLQVEVIGLYRAVFLTWLQLAPHMPFTASFLADDVSEDIVAIWEHEDLPVPDTNMAVADTCLAVVNAMVADYGPRVQLMREDSQWPLGMSYPRIRTLLGLQVLGWLSSEETIRRCENATCGRPFVRHQGRTRGGSTHAEGIKYCSAGCARAQASRTYRQRKRVS